MRSAVTPRRSNHTSGKIRSSGLPLFSPLAVPRLAGRTSIETRLSWLGGSKIGANFCLKSPDGLRSRRPRRAVPRLTALVDDVPDRIGARRSVSSA